MNPWDITRIEHDPLGGPDIAHFADGYHMPIKPRPPTLGSFKDDSLRDYLEAPRQPNDELAEARAEIARLKAELRIWKPDERRRLISLGGVCYGAEGEPGECTSDDSHLDGCENEE